MKSTYDGGRWLSRTSHFRAEGILITSRKDLLFLEMLFFAQMKEKKRYLGAYNACIGKVCLASS